MLRNETDFFITGIAGIVRVDTVHGHHERIHRNRPSYGLVYNVSGQACYLFGDCILEGGADAIIFLPKGSDYVAEVQKKGECIAINFDMLCDRPLRPMLLSCPPNGHLLSLFKRAEKLFVSSPQNNSFLLLATIYEIFAEISHAMRFRHMKDENAEKLERAVAFMEEHYAQPSLTVKQIAASVDLQEARFRVLFTQVYGKSPIQYLLSMRLNKARQLLCEPGVRIADIAQASGFENPYYFSRVFAQKVGVSPSEFRKAQLESL